MADENVVNLTQATLDLVEKQIRLDKLKLTADYNKQEKEELETLKRIIAEKQAYINKQRDAIQINKKTVESINTETAKKKALLEEYKKGKEIISAAGLSVSQYNKELTNLRRNLEETAKQQKIDINLRNKTTTVSSLWRDIKNKQYGAVIKQYSEAGGIGGIGTNTLSAFGGPVGLVVAGLTSLATATNKLYNEFVVTSVRMHNIAGQQLGFAAESRNLYGGNWAQEWASRTLLGYSAEQQQELFSGLVDALRINPNTEQGQKAYEYALEGMMANQRIFGTSTGTMNKVYKAFDQMNISSTQLSERFYTLMRSVEGTGWTTSEYGDMIGKNIMYLKNFGINLDVYSKDLLKYGEAIRKEQLTTADLSPKTRGESTAEMAFIARKMLSSGIISEETLGAGLGSSMTQQSGSLRAYARSHPAEYFQMIYRLYQKDPMLNRLLQNAVGGGGAAAEMEAMTMLSLPGTGAISELSTSQLSPEVWTNIMQGKLGSKPSTGGGDVQPQQKIVYDAMKLTAKQTDGLKGLLYQIAALIRNHANSLPGSVPSDFQTGEINNANT